ncbi:MAG: hypothetical protein Kow0077_12950 [Anaerolineae bacterium]
MIFQYTWPEVVTKRKTVTRRIIAPGEYAIRTKYNRIASVKHNGRVKWCVGKTYAVQPGRGQKQVARIKLTRITSEKLSRISNHEARAEGFTDRQEFLRTWEEIHGSDMLECRVWVLEFKLVDLMPSLMHLTFSMDSVQFLREIGLKNDNIRFDHTWSGMS